MCTKHHRNGFISGTSEGVKFVENVLCSQKFNHILCGNILIVCSCVFLVFTDLLQLYTPSQSLHSSAHSRILIRQEKFQGAVHFVILALSSRIVCHFLSAVLELSSVKLLLKVHLISIYFQLYLNPSSSVCVWTNVTWESFFE